MSMRTNAYLRASVTALALAGIAGPGALAVRADPGVIDLYPDPSSTLTGAAEADPEGLGDFFAGHVSACGDWLFVGAAREADLAQLDGKDDGEADGAVYAFRRGRAGRYELHQRIPPGDVSDVGAGDRFGAGAILVGGQLLVGVANEPDGLFFGGAVAVHRQRHDGLWTRTPHTILAPEPSDFGAFAARTYSFYVVADRDGEHLYIGEPVNRREPAPRGIHVYRRDGAGRWRRIQTVLAPDDPRGLAQGIADEIIALDRGYFAVSSAVAVPPLDENFVPSALVLQLHLYGPAPGGRLSSLPLETIEVMSSFPELTEGFAQTGLAYARGRLIVADPLADVDGVTAAGALRVYRFRPDARPRLSLESIIPNPAPAEFDLLGASYGAGRQCLAYDGRRLAVGSSQASSAGGAFFLNGLDVYVFERSGSRFELAARLKSTTPPSDVRVFGQSVTFVDGRVAVGEMRGLREVDGGGRLLFYDLPGCRGGDGDGWDGWDGDDDY